MISSANEDSEVCTLLHEILFRCLTQAPTHEQQRSDIVVEIISTVTLSAATVDSRDLNFQVRVGTNIGKTQKVEKVVIRRGDHVDIKTIVHIRAEVSYFHLFTGRFAHARRQSATDRGSEESSVPMEL
jgi:hypothetical protein